MIYIIMTLVIIAHAFFTYYYMRLAFRYDYLVVDAIHYLGPDHPTIRRYVRTSRNHKMQAAFFFVVGVVYTILTVMAYLKFGWQWGLWR